MRKLADLASIKEGATIIKQGGLVAFPTETVYGLGGDATNCEAVAKIFAVKNRPFFDPLIVHISSQEEAYSLWQECPPIATKLMEIFWPGPLTLVLPKTDKIPDLVTASLPTVAVRMPDHATALDLIRESHCPIAAPSANQFNHLSPSTAEAVEEELGQSIELILDGGPTRVGIESTVIAFDQHVPVVLRPGGITLEALQEVLGEKIAVRRSTQNMESPGMLNRHYSPRTPLYLLREEEENVPLSKNRFGAENAGLLAFKPPTPTFDFEHTEVLSTSGDLREAAARFFQALRRLDSYGLKAIIATPFPENGLGLALMDRLRKAAVGEATFFQNQLFLKENEVS